MNPIEVVLVNNEGPILKIIGSPIFSFIAGSVLTIILTVLMQKRNELQSTKDKILEIHKGMNDEIDCLNTILYYLNPEANITIDVLLENKRYESEEEFLREVENNKKRIIREQIDETQRIKNRILPIIELYISNKNRMYFIEFFKCIDKIWNEFVEVPFISKKVYDPKVQYIIILMTKTNYLTTMNSIFERIYIVELDLFNTVKSWKLYRKYKDKIDYDAFFKSAEKSGENHLELIERYKNKTTT